MGWSLDWDGANDVGARGGVGGRGEGWRDGQLKTYSSTG